MPARNTALWHAITVGILVFAQATFIEIATSIAGRMTTVATVVVMACTLLIYVLGVMFGESNGGAD